MTVTNAKNLQRTAAAAPISASRAPEKATALLDAARSELGYKEGPNNYNKFSPHLGMQNVPWCAAFVSHLLDKSGAGEGILKNGGSASVAGLSEQFREAGRYRPNGGYTPQPGDVIFFSASHTGIVEKVENGKVYTIEGNTSNSVARRAYPVGDAQIAGYGQTFMEKVPNDAVGAPADLDKLATRGHRAARDVSTGYSGPGAANRRGTAAHDYFLGIERLIAALEAGLSMEEILALLQATTPGLDPEAARLLALELSKNPKLLEALKADPELLQKIAAQPELIGLLGRPGGADELLKRVGAPDRYEDAVEDPMSSVVPNLPPAAAPQGTPELSASLMRTEIKG